MNTDLQDRGKVIEEIVRRWQKKNTDKMVDFAGTVKDLRQLKPYENLAMFYKVTIPADLYRQLDLAISTDGARFLDPKGELAWFINAFPEFTVSYDRTEMVK